MVLYTAMSKENAFCREYGVQLPYIAGGMYKGISSKELVLRMAQANLLSFFGAGGMSLVAIEDSIRYISERVDKLKCYGVNLLCNYQNPASEMLLVDLLLRYRVPVIEAAGFTKISPSLVLYRLKGAHKLDSGKISVPNKVIAKVSNLSIATSFMNAASAEILTTLVSSGKLTENEAAIGREVPIASDICVEADSGGHTDQGAAFVLIPSFVRLRNRHPLGCNTVRIGAAGGIGTPEAVAGAFLLGAEFITTGSINQCTVEAGTSNSVKEILQEVGINDTCYAPSGDMFEVGSKIQVIKRGIFFPARANKLYQLYLQYNSISELSLDIQVMLQEKYFRKSFESIWLETKQYYLASNPAIVEEATKNPKKKMALIFRWYFVNSHRLAQDGNSSRKTDYQILSGPSIGAFNLWVKGTMLEKWHNRHVDEIGIKLMNEAKLYLKNK